MEARTILNAHKRVDSWFGSIAGMNLFRGCGHDCVYCDGRAETYYVEGEFGSEVAVKINAPQLLDRALDPRRKRKPLKPGYILLGGGVGDSYQPAERDHRIARRCLEVIEAHSRPVHLLTKSSLVERDLDILQRINRTQRVIVSISFSTVDDRLGRLLEPGSSPPTARLQTLRRCKQAGLATGMYLMPVLPFLSDNIDQINQSVAAARRTGVDFVIFGGLTLKDGRQKQHFLKTLSRHWPDLAKPYSRLYPGNRWGNAGGDYYSQITRRFSEAAVRHRVARRIPSRLLSPFLSADDLVGVLLQNLEYLARLEGRPAPYGSAARSIARQEAPVSTMTHRLRELPGVGPTTERLILEILSTGTCSYHDSFFPD